MPHGVIHYIFNYVDMKKIVIIGASSGLGQRIAMDFARAGWRVGIAARREAPLQAIKEEFPGNVAYSVIDVTQVDAPKKFLDLIEMINGMDILLYTAGTGFCDPELDDTRLDNTLQTNVVGFARITAAAYKYYRDTASARPGQIAAITSVAGTKGIGISAAYSSSKRFQQMFLNSLDQLAHQQHVNVRITDIRPGFIRTPLLNEDKPYPLLMSVDYAAPLIERAILRHKRVSVIDSRWAIVTGLWKLVPECIWRHIAINF